MLINQGNMIGYRQVSKKYNIKENTVNNWVLKQRV